MARDAQGHELSNATPQSARHLDEAVRAFILAYGDANAHVMAARDATDGCAMVRLLEAWLLAMSNDPALVARADRLVRDVRELAMTPREETHLAALSDVVAGRWAEAVGRLDRHLTTYPGDLLAHQCAMRLDGFQGRFHRVAARTARALPQWDKDQPGYGMLLSFYGFGLEEAGDYGRAEEVSRAAAELEPYGYWPHHAVSHVLEMTGRPDEGLGWMDGRRSFWSGPGNTNRVHIWWHQALFHLELGQSEAALALYDAQIVPTLRPVGTSLCNATALLWRLELMGVDGGQRWQAVSRLWQDRASGRHSVFNDIHAAMTALRNDDGAAVERLVQAMRNTAAGSGGLAETYAAIGLPVVESMACFRRGGYGEAIEKLLPARLELWRMGGSKAQRDLVDWTLAEAAIRAGDSVVSLALANERLALRPNSEPSRALLARAQKIGA